MVSCSQSLHVWFRWGRLHNTQTRSITCVQPNQHNTNIIIIIITMSATNKNNTPTATTAQGPHPERNNTQNRVHSNIPSDPEMDDIAHAMPTVSVTPKHDDSLDENNRSSTTIQWFVKPDDMREFLVQWSIYTINLVEALFTTFFFDETKFPFVTIAVVMTFLPLLDSFCKSLVYVTNTPWDDFVIDLLSEGAQAWIYLYFCNFSQPAKVWIPLFMGLQIALTCVLYSELLCPSRGHCHNDTNHQDTDTATTTVEQSANPSTECSTRRGIPRSPRPVEELDRQAQFTVTFVHKCVLPSVFAVFLGVVPILYFFTQGNSPFHDLHFQLVFATYAWVVENAQRVIHEALFEFVVEQLAEYSKKKQDAGLGTIEQGGNQPSSDKDEEGPMRMTESERKKRMTQVSRMSFSSSIASATSSLPSQPSPPSVWLCTGTTREDAELVAMRKGWFPIVVNVMAYAAMLVYVSILSWMWYLNDDNTRVYDQIITLMNMVTCGVIVLCCMCHGCLQYIASATEPHEHFGLTLCLCLTCTFCICLVLAVLLPTILLLGPNNN